MSLIDPNNSLLRKQLKIIEVRRENGCMWTLDKNKQQIEKKSKTIKANVFTTNTKSLTKLPNTLYTHFIIYQITNTMHNPSDAYFQSKEEE